MSEIVLRPRGPVTFRAKAASEAAVAQKGAARVRTGSGAGSGRNRLPAAEDKQRSKRQVAVKLGGASSAQRRLFADRENASGGVESGGGGRISSTMAVMSGNQASQLAEEARNRCPLLLYHPNETAEAGNGDVASARRVVRGCAGVTPKVEGGERANRLLLGSLFSA